MLVTKKSSLTSLADLPCTQLQGVGPRVAEYLQKLNIYTVQDLLFHLPIHYQNRTRITPISNLRVGDQAVVEGVITAAQLKRGRKNSLLCLLEDASAAITLRFFYFTYLQQQKLSQTGVRVRCFGEVRWGANGLEMVHPEYRLMNEAVVQPVEENLTPIYPTTEGLSQISFRKLTAQALAFLKNGAGLEEYLPEQLLQQFHLPDLLTAIQFVHRPPPDAVCEQLESGIHPCQQRLAFEELLAHQLSLRKLRNMIQHHLAPSLTQNNALIASFLANLPFELTAAQKRVAAEVANDLALNQPMLRLVQGDVGSGKTIIAALAMLQAVANGYQAALMAPTELLAEQHLQNFKRWLQPLNITVVWLAGSLKVSERKHVLQQINNGQAQIIIGTHALFQKNVSFQRLGIVVIDEQHRFGVQQRLHLREKGKQEYLYPHQLIMTATPIPRTLAMSAYADLDCSIIDELPPGRTPITSVLISNQRREEVVARVRHACRNGQQAYWVCTLIAESEILQCQAAEATAELLKKLLPELRLGLVHGRMKAQEKEQIMAAFKAGDIDLLVATTVIEVGVDVPNASLMIIENAERLGLSQLHQLRGRVGRGNKTSHCVLLYQWPLSQLAKQRLQLLKDSQDGFEIAQKDLELRGPGEVLGTRQTGLMRMRIADLMRDRKLLSAVQQAADSLLRLHEAKVDYLIKRWLPQGEKYGSV